MKNKLTLLKEYVSLHGSDLYFSSSPGVDNPIFLQQELRRLWWLIEDATCDQIQTQINNYKSYADYE